MAENRGIEPHTNVRVTRLAGGSNHQISLFSVKFRGESGIRTDTCTGFKSVASANWATGAYKTKNPNFFRGSGLYLFGVIYFITR